MACAQLWVIKVHNEQSVNLLIILDFHGFGKKGKKGIAGLDKFDIAIFIETYFKNTHLCAAIP